MTKRIFVSIDLPPESKDYLRSLQKKDIYWIKWMKPDNLHITLNFLGELRPSEIEEAKQVLAEVAEAHEPFSVRLSMPKPERDMLWIVPEEAGAIFDIQSELKGKLKHARLGKTERRSYKPHILLCKSKTGRMMSWTPEHFKPIEYLVDKINLYESELTIEAATHRLVQSFPFGMKNL